jgi:hypothetical protein
MPAEPGSMRKVWSAARTAFHLVGAFAAAVVPSSIELEISSMT